MKGIKSILVSVVLVIPMLLWAQTPSITEISTAVKAGDVAQLATYIQNNVEITIEDKEGAYSRDQAVVLLRNFFGSNKPTSFQMRHKGKSKEGSTYGIGVLQTSSGSYDTYFFVKQVGNKLVLQEIRFEEA